MFLQLIASFAAIALVIPVASKGIIGKRQSTGECYKFYENGDCKCCEDKFRGTKCEHYCETCKTFNNSIICEYFCPDGHYGYRCEHQCPDSCKKGISGLPICKELGNTFDCVNGCKEGLFGIQCSNTCSTKCKNSICNKMNGICIGCQDGYFGNICDKNCLHCVGGCFQNGTCKGGCKEGYIGPLCDTKCLTSCEQCKETCSMQCNESCPETVFEICSKNSTCAYTCSGFYENNQICSKKTVPPAKVEETEESHTLVIVLVSTGFVVIVVAVIACCVIKRRRGGRGAYCTRRTKTDLDAKAAEDDKDNNEYLLGDRPTNGESTVLMSDTSNEIMRSTTHSDDNERLLKDRPTDGEALEQPPDTSNEIGRSTAHSAQDEDDTKEHLGDGGTQRESFDQQPQRKKIVPDKIQEIGSQSKKGIVVITSSPEGKESIIQMLEKPEQISIKGMKAEFTIGKIGSKDVASIHLIKDQDGKIKNANYITLLLGKFKHVKHVIILGVCSVSENQREVIRLGDVVTSVANFAPEDDSLQNIVKNFIALGDRTPWERHLGPDNKVPTLHRGIFGSEEEAEDERDHAIFAMGTRMGQVLESITGSKIESFLLVCAVSKDNHETAESTRAAAAVVRAVVEQIDDGLG